MKITQKRDRVTQTSDWVAKNVKNMSVLNAGNHMSIDLNCDHNFKIGVYFCYFTHITHYFKLE